MAAADPAYLLSRADQRFLLHDWLAVAELAERPRFEGQSSADYEEVLALAERMAAELFAPHNRAADLEEPRLQDGRVVLTEGVAEALRAYAEAGLIGTGVAASAGGMQLPLAVANAASAWFQAANAATSGYALLTTAAANLLATNAAPEQVERWVPPLVEGRFFGTMCISEPGAGSSLADITTRAEPEPGAAGTYRLTGTKMWISAGEHELAENIVHMVLAKVPGAGEGVRGIGLFIVPRFLLDAEGRPAERNDVALAGLNHKMGFRGTVNTVLNFGEGGERPGGRAGAVGYLVGEAGRGLAYMFRMMNEARIGVGLVAAALGSAGYLKSLRYARERPQGRPREERDASAPQVPIIQHADVRRMLLAQKAYVEGAMALVLYCSRLYDDAESLADPEARRRAGLLLEILTPIAKSWPSQWCLEANSLAIQVLGGYGYSREYDVEQHYRDNRLNPIHEGTHGIQAIDLLGRKAGIAGGAARAALAELLRSTEEPARAAGGEVAALSRRLAALVDRWEAISEDAVASGPDAAVLANASAYMEATGDLVIGHIWLSQLLAIGDREGDFFAGKRQAARFFFGHALPRAAPLLDLVGAPDRTVLEMRDEWF